MEVPAAARVNIAKVIWLCQRMTGLLSVVARPEKIHLEASTTLHIIGSDVFFEIVEPEDLRYTYRTRPANDFGPSFNDEVIDKNIPLVPLSPPNGCSWPTNALEVLGNVALIERGDCTFLSKTIIAEKVGARAVIIADNSENEDNFTKMMDDLSGRETNIPATFLLGKNGAVIRQTLERLGLKYALINIPVNVSFVPMNEWRQPPWTTW